MISPYRQIYISTSSFPVSHLSGIIDICKMHDIRALEFNTIQDFDIETLRMQDLSVLFHNYFPPPDEPFVLNLAAADETGLIKSRKMCMTAIDWTRQFKGSHYAAHAGYRGDIAVASLGNPPMLKASLGKIKLSTYGEAYQTLLESILCLNAHAKEAGVRFLIENQVIASDYRAGGSELILMVQSDELLRLIRDVDDNNFGLLVDLGHLKVTSETLGFDRKRFIDDVSPYIAAFHISDNDGRNDQHRPFTENAWFLPILSDYPGATLTIELERAEVGDILRSRSILEWYL